MKYEITEEQIKELAKGNAKLKTMFPEVFETKLEVGKWYKYNNFLIYVIDETHWCGYDACKNWQNNIYYDNLLKDKDFKPATDSEVLEALKNEFKKQNPNIEYFDTIYNASLNILDVFLLDKRRVTIFNNGIFTKFHTKEEAEKLLNAKII